MAKDHDVVWVQLSRPAGFVVEVVAEADVNVFRPSRASIVHLFRSRLTEEPYADRPVAQPCPTDGSAMIAPFLWRLSPPRPTPLDKNHEPIWRPEKIADPLSAPVED